MTQLESDHSPNAIVPINTPDPDSSGVARALAVVPEPSLREAIDSWLRATTDSSSPRYDDLARDKGKAVGDFFAFVNAMPDEVGVNDVKAYHAHLESKGLAQATVYALLSRISSFYKWLNDLPEIQGQLPNPVAAARPKAPKPYQSESTKSLTDEQVRALVGVVRARADSGDVVGLRDYAMLVAYLLTGLRRAEIARLRWGDVDFSGGTAMITYRAKGGDVLTRQIDPRVREAILGYLRAAGRLDEMTPASPIWTRHDRAGEPGRPLTSHAFAKNLKMYGRLAGLDHVHIHQTRHTYARIVADETGSLVETQDALGHVNATTTRVYVQRVGIKRDKHGDQVAERLGL
jgi:integrase